MYAATAVFGTVAFFTTFIVFLGNLPKLSDPWLRPSIDVGPSIQLELALIWNAALITLFCLQHSLMARARVKRIIATVLPAPLERATYVHAANLAGFLILILWQPVPLVLWHVENEVLETMMWTAFGVGWLLFFASAVSIDMLELLGLRQAWAWFQGRSPQPLALKTNWLYHYLEHPMYIGVILGFWMTPHMTLGHAALAAQLTLYIAVAVRYEHRDLQARFGEDYEAWRFRKSRPAIPSYTRAIAQELSRRLQPVTFTALTPQMRVLLLRLHERS